MKSRISELAIFFCLALLHLLAIMFFLRVLIVPLTMNYDHYFFAVLSQLIKLLCTAILIGSWILLWHTVLTVYYIRKVNKLENLV